MAYSDFTVVTGGIIHVPIVVGLLKFFDGVTSKNYLAEKAARDAAEAKAKKEAEAKAQEEAARQKAAEAAKAKADAEAKAKAKEESNQTDGDKGGA